MRNNTMMWIVGLAGAYFFLTTRQPVYAQQADGTYQPSGLLDRLTVALTGNTTPPAPQPARTSISFPGFNLQVQ